MRGEKEKGSDRGILANIWILIDDLQTERDNNSEREQFVLDMSASVW